jgi:tRNA(adenine34) deaminase
MYRALAEAARAEKEGEVPVGAIIVYHDQIIASAYNQREQLHDPTAHAEMIALTQAAEYLQSWRLMECRMYVTLEPCPMCAGAILQARLPELVFGAFDPKAGAVVTLYNLLSDPRLNHRTVAMGGILADECGAILSRFFAAQRDSRKG